MKRVHVSLVNVSSPAALQLNMFAHTARQATPMPNHGSMWWRVGKAQQAVSVFTSTATSTWWKRAVVGLQIRLAQKSAMAKFMAVVPAT